ncbi:methylaspartate mutase subunit S [Chloroflexota bacterium]
MDRKRVILTGVIGADAHTFGTKILTYALKEAGFDAVSLGVLVSQEEFINAAIETKADAILISSLYGMAMLDCEGLRDKCEEVGLKHILLYIGGQLTTSGEKFEEIESKFKQMGFNRVYPPGTSPAIGIADLKKDLCIKD